MNNDGATNALPCYRLDQLASDSALKSFQSTGCLQISDFLPVDVVASLKTAAEQCFETNTRAGAFLNVGDKRRMITLPVSDVFDDARLHSPAPLMACFEALLGPGHVINCFGCVVSEPGAKTQHTHTDYSGLFGSAMDYLSPSYAINLFVPLVELNDINGSTEMWPGTHRKPHASPEDHPGVCPQVPLGSAVIMDYRVQHRGTANHARKMRPILTIAYSRRWFMDTSNFAALAPLDIGKARYDAMDDAHKTLFGRAKLYFRD